MLVFILFYHILGYDAYIGYAGKHHEVTDYNGNVQLFNSIFQSFHNALPEEGGAIYINNPTFKIQFTSLGFSDCSTANNGGAFYLFANYISINNVCGYMCEAISNKGQFFIVKNDQYTQNNIFTFVTIVNCGPKNVGHSSIIINDDSSYEFTYINSSNNYNYYSDKSYGTCFTTEFVKSFKVEHFNFLCSTGIDIINTHDIPTGTFKSGNIQNCSTDYIFKYRGDITFLDTYFDKNTYRINSFFHSGPDFISTKINFTNCHFDVKPAGIIMDASNVEDNPLITTLINGLENLDKCPIPSDRFTLSDDFTLSNVFTCSSEFTR